MLVSALLNPDLRHLIGPSGRRSNNVQVVHIGTSLVCKVWSARGLEPDRCTVLHLTSSERPASCETLACHPWVHVAWVPTSISSNRNRPTFGASDPASPPVVRTGLLPCSAKPVLAIVCLALSCVLVNEMSSRAERRAAYSSLRWRAGSRNREGATAIGHWDHAYPLLYIVAPIQLSARPLNRLSPI
jgi:hypothetical protein